MRDATKTAGALLALTAPIAVGWAYTAGASVGESGSGISDLFTVETVDEFLVDGYVITREGHDGVVSMRITGPDGAATDPGHIPEDVAARLAFYEHDWSPSQASSFDEVDGATCYEPIEDLGPGGTIMVEEDENDTFRLLSASADEAGNLSLEAVEYDKGQLTPEQIQGIRSGQLEIADLPQGTAITACDA